MQTENADAYEGLIQFLYRAPIGLVQTRLDGAVEMLNPMASNLLMPLATDGGLDNLFTVLQKVAPRLQRMAADFDQPSGIVCEALRVPLGATAPGAPLVLSISVLKLDRQRLMATVADATLEMQREQDRRARTDPPVATSIWSVGGRSAPRTRSPACTSRWSPTVCPKASLI